MKAVKLCQYPVTGEVHFYVYTRIEGIILFYVCQYPVTGEVHFYMNANTPSI